MSSAERLAMAAAAARELLARRAGGGRTVLEIRHEIVDPSPNGPSPSGEVHVLTILPDGSQRRRIEEHGRD